MILGCQLVGERAVVIVQVVAIGIAAGMSVDNMAEVPLSFSTYAGILGRAAYRAAQQIYPEFQRASRHFFQGLRPARSLRITPKYSRADSRACSASW